ncbi:hypothetical protein [uncultured Mediterranean phage]|nr:hypothetical protein [uncultured Mediterranean phage]
MIVWGSFYLWDNSASAYVDHEFAVSDIPGAAVDLIAQTTDKIYMGLDRKFYAAFFELETAGDYGTLLDWEYWDGSAWKNLPISRNYVLDSISGVIQFRMPNDWATSTLTGIENTNAGLKTEDTSAGTAKYWIRVSTSAVTITATMKRSFPFPSYGYTTPVRIAQFLQLRQNFSSTTAPSIEEVERVIERVESRLDRYTTNSWKPNYRQDETYEFSRYGIVLKRQPAIKVIDLSIWDGSAFNVMLEGRAQDYFVDEKTGIIPLTRLLSIPFTYTRSAIYTWGFGEFKRAINVNYVWGRDFDEDVAAGQVEDITTKLASADIISNYDYTALVPQGTDRFALEQKVNLWRESADERMEELRSVRIWVP